MTCAAAGRVRPFFGAGSRFSGETVTSVERPAGACGRSIAGMGGRELRTLLEGGAYFEGPRWHEGRWWVSDFYRRTVSTVTEDGQETIVMEVEGQPSGTGWTPDGSMLVVSRK